jgi:substrate import-associated zinc metallohydrolase lipoprotein
MEKSTFIKTGVFNIGRKLLPALILIITTTACYESEVLNVPVKNAENEPQTELDIYIDENFTREYGMAIRYRFVDRYVRPQERVTPPRLAVVKPMLDFIQNFWIDPFLEVKNGEAFFRNHVPAEIIFLGGFIYNEDGTVTLGTADAGAKITFTNVNAINVEDEAWRDQQLQTVYHEFAHIVHQEYKLPASFENISASGYTSAGSWFTLTDEQALRRGFVSPYATSSPNEDFAEIVAFYLFEQDFMNRFINKEINCETSACISRNEGRALIREKLNAIRDHYKKVTGVDLDEVRKAVQARL